MNLLAIVAAFAVLGGTYLGNETPIDIDHASFPSPDKKLLASFEHDDDGWDYLKITDAKTGRKKGSIKIELPPIFSVQWTQDSRSIVLVGHVAHGSTLILVDSQGDNWLSSIFYPSDFYCDPAYAAVFYDVKKLETHSNRVNVTYKITVQEEANPGEIAKEQSCLESLSFDPRTKKILHSTRTPLR